MKYSYKIIAGQKVQLFGNIGTALNSICVPIEVLFNENDTCGEVMPLENATLNIKTKDDTVVNAQITKGENFILNHEDITAA